MLINIDGSTFEAKEGQTILSVAKANGIFVPTLCHDPKLKPASLCRICLVEVKGSSNWLPACSTVVKPSMEIQTESHKLLQYRRWLLNLTLSKIGCDDHSCHSCPSDGNCELQILAERYQLWKAEEKERAKGEGRKAEKIRKIICRGELLCSPNGERRKKEKRQK